MLKYEILPADFFIFNENEEGTRFYVIIKGSCKVLKLGEDADYVRMVDIFTKEFSKPK